MPARSAGILSFVVRSRDEGREDGEKRCDAGGKEARCRRRAQREAALDGEVSDVEDAEGQVDADGEERPKESLGNRWYDEIHREKFSFLKKQPQGIACGCFLVLIGDRSCNYSKICASFKMSAGIWMPSVSAFFLLMLTFSSFAISIGMSAGFFLPSRMSAAM